MNTSNENVSENMIAPQSRTILLVGDRGVGKTSYIRRLSTGQFLSAYYATTNILEHVLNFEVSKGSIYKVSIIETYGKINNIENLVNNNVNIIFLMFNKSTSNSVPSRIQILKRIFPTIKIIVIKNMTDLSTELNIKNKTLIRFLADKYIEISVKSCYNYEKPILEAIKN